MNENLENPREKPEKTSQPLKFERLSDASLEEIEAKLNNHCDIIRKYAKELHKKYSPYNEKSVEEFIRKVTASINGLNDTLTADERKKLKDSGKYPKTKANIIFSFRLGPPGPPAIMGGWEWKHSYSEELIDGYVTAG